MTRASALATRSASVTISPECTVHVTHSDTNFLPLGLISILVSATGQLHTYMSRPATCATPSSSRSAALPLAWNVYLDGNCVSVSRI